MIPVIIKPDGASDFYCAGRQYRFEAINCEDADLIRWQAVSTPPEVDFDDVQQTSPLGPINYMVFPIPGEYCFDVECGIIVPRLSQELLDEALLEQQEAIDEQLEALNEQIEELEMMIEDPDPDGGDGNTGGDGGGGENPIP